MVCCGNKKYKITIIKNGVDNFEIEKLINFFYEMIKGNRLNKTIDPTMCTYTVITKMDLAEFKNNLLKIIQAFQPNLQFSITKK